MGIEGELVNVLSVYAPQVGCTPEEKGILGDAMVRRKRGRGGNGKIWNERCNEEGRLWRTLQKRMDMAVVYTYFKKRGEHSVA